MQDTLFSEVSAEESALVNGGTSFTPAPGFTAFAFDWNNLFYTLGVGTFFGLDLFRDAVTSSIFRRYF